MYQRAVKAAKSKYLSEFIGDNLHRPKTLFSVIDSVLSSPVNIFPDASVLPCEQFCTFFNEKTVQLRSNLTFGNSVQPERSSGPMLWNDFQPVSFESCKGIVERLRSTSSSQDIIPSRFLKQIFSTVGHDLLTVFNTSLITGGGCE